VQTTQDLFQRAVTPSSSGSGAGIHFQSSSHLRVTSPIIIRAHNKVFPYFANANDTICPLNRAPMCTKFRKVITEERTINPRTSKITRAFPTRLLNQITRKSKFVDRNSVSCAGPTIVCIRCVATTNFSVSLVITHNRKFVKNI